MTTAVPEEYLMTQSAEQTGPVTATSQDPGVDAARSTAGEPAAATEPADRSLRQLLTELAGLEDILRDGPVGEQSTALAREQEILAELHCRSLDDGILPDRN